MRPPSPILVQSEGLVFAHPGTPLFDRLDLAIGPGLTLVRGGDGRGKTTLLRLLAGQLAPQAGRVRRSASTVCFETPADPMHDECIAGDWLRAVQDRFPGWDERAAAGAVAGFGLSEHLAKPMAQLSAGSRRKLGLVAAMAGGAVLTLLDTPFAALDGRSSRFFVEALRHAAADADRAWVVADPDPAALQGLPLAAIVDLGD